MAGQTVRITIGTVWNFQVDPTLARPPRITGHVMITSIVLTVARIIFGIVYLKECPQQPNIPNFLLGMALITLLSISFITLPCESETAQRMEPPGGFKACMLCLLNLYIFTWIILGDVWIFSIYQPNYDPTVADGLYCDKTLYVFAFWNAVLETLGVGVLLAKLCRGLVFYVVMVPAPANPVVYRNV